MTFDGSKYGGVLINPKPTVESNKFDGSKYGGFLIEKEPKESSLRMAAQAPRNLAAGVGDVVDLPIMGVNYLLDKAHKGIYEKSGKPRPENKFQIPYPGNKIAEGIDYVTGGYTAPQTKRERMAEAGTRAVGSLASGFGAGTKLAQLGGKVIPKIGRGLAKVNPFNPTSAAATGAGAVAQQAYRENRPDDLLGTLGTGLATDMAVRTGLGLFNPRNYASAFKINPKHVESFRAAGISPTLGQVSDNPIVKVGENIVKETSPFNKLRDASARQYDDIKEILGPGVQQSALSELEAGKSLKRSMAEYGHKASDVTEKLKRRYSDKVAKSPVGDLVDVTDSLNFFENIEHGLKTAQSKADLLNTPLGKQYESLKARAIENKGSVPLPDLEEFRRKVFDEISKGEIGSVSRGRLTQLRSKVNNDIKDYMEGIGASKEWDRYNNFYSKYAERRKPHLVESREVPDFEANKIFDSIGHSGKLDRSLLDSAYASQKKTGQKETFDALIQKMGKSGDDYSPHLLAKRIKAQPKETQDTLFRALSVPMRNKFKAVLDSIDTMKELNKFGNPSRTAYTTAVMEGAKAAPFMAYNFYSGNDQSDTVWQYGLLTALSYGLSNKLMANPKFINWAYKGTKLETPKSKMHHLAGLKGVIGRPAYQEFKNALGEKKPQ